MNKQNRNKTHKYRESWLPDLGGGVLGAWVKQVKGIKRYKLSVTK